MRDVAERKALLRAQALLTLQLQTLVGNVSGLLLGVEHMELVASRGGSVQTQYDGWFCGLHIIYSLVTFIEHSLDTTKARTRNDYIAHMQCTIADQHRTHIATPLIE